ncbi:hypothetical protein ACFSTC_35710 [Nonomuraea ferruginea]
MALEAASRYPFGRVIGVELSPELTEIARSNLAEHAAAAACRRRRVRALGRAGVRHPGRRQRGVPEQPVPRADLRHRRGPADRLRRPQPAPRHRRLLQPRRGGLPARHGPFPPRADGAARDGRRRVRHDPRLRSQTALSAPEGHSVTALRAPSSSSAGGTGCRSTTVPSSSL